MNNSTCHDRLPMPPAWRSRRFPLMFIISTVIATTAASYLPDSWLNLWRDLLITVTRTIGNATGLIVQYSGDIMTVNGFPMRIIYQCTALHYVIIVSCAITLSRWHSLKYRLAGVAAAIPLLILCNAVRLLCTGLAGTVSRAAFVFVHSYLWVTIFILLSFAIWVLWDKKTLAIVGLNRFTAMAAGFCTLFHYLFASWSYQIDCFTAGLAALLLKILPGSTGSTIGMYAGKVLFTAGHDAFTFSISTELTTISVFAGLATAEVFHNRRANVPRLLAGGSVLFLLSIIIITACCLIMVYAGKEAATLSLWVCQGIMLALPLGAWWLASRPAPTAAVPDMIEQTA